MRENVTGSKIYVRIAVILLVTIAVGGIFLSAVSGIVRNLTRLYADRLKEEEEAEVDVLTGRVKDYVAQERLSFEQALEADIYEMVEGYDVYLSGMDGMIYFEGRQEGILAENMVLPMNKLYMHTVTFADGSGYIMVKSNIDMRNYRNFQVYVLIATGILMFFISFWFLKRQLTELLANRSEEQPDMKGLSGTADDITEEAGSNAAYAGASAQVPDLTEVTGQAADIDDESGKPVSDIPVSEEDKVYTDLTVLLEQYEAERNLGVQIKKHPTPVFITADIGKFIRVLDCIWDALTEKQVETAGVGMHIEAEDQLVQLYFEIPDIPAESDRLLDEKEHIVIRECLFPVNGRAEEQESSGSGKELILKLNR